MRMDWDVEHLAGLVGQRMAAAGMTTRFMLGICGPPGSGKSTLAHKLAHACGGNVLGMDGFHLTNKQLDAMGLRARKGSSATFDVEHFAMTLKLLRAAEAAVATPIYSRLLHEIVPGAVVIEPDVRLVVVEGNYLLLEEEPWIRARRLLDEVWYLDVGIELCMQRVRERHIRGGCTVEQAEKKITQNDRLNAEAIAATRLRADRVIAGEAANR